ncbi:hypothetical protein EDF56_112118 [Novosphingobium sp. PhB165]|nr:hypothetical protein EDF56_112118 [Novosphingobium sp. PhB165]
MVQTISAVLSGLTGLIVLLMFKADAPSYLCDIGVYVGFAFAVPPIAGAFRDVYRLFR